MVYAEPLRHYSAQLCVADLPNLKPPTQYIGHFSLTDPVTPKYSISPNSPIPVLDGLVSNVADRYCYRQSVADDARIKYTDISDYVVFSTNIGS